MIENNPREKSRALAVFHDDEGYDWSQVLPEEDRLENIVTAHGRKTSKSQHYVFVAEIKEENKEEKGTTEIKEKTREEILNEKNYRERNIALNRMDEMQEEYESAVINKRWDKKRECYFNKEGELVVPKKDIIFEDVLLIIPRSAEYYRNVLKDDTYAKSLKKVAEEVKTETVEVEVVKKVEVVKEEEEDLKVVEKEKIEEKIEVNEEVKKTVTEEQQVVEDEKKIESLVEVKNEILEIASDAGDEVGVERKQKDADQTEATENTEVDEVRNMGFGAILDININHISTRLAYWLARNFDENFDTLNVGKLQIKITSDTVYEVFGIPKGPKQVEIIADKRKVKKQEKIDKSKEPGNAVRDTFISQWGENMRITHGLIENTMENQRDGGSLFRLNFLVYWMTFFAEITKATTANDRCFLGVVAVEEIQNLDWCSFVLDTLRRTRAGRKNYKIQFVGPVAFLTLLYTHEYNKKLKLFEKVVEIPIIRYITSSEIDKVEEHISDNGPLWTSSESEEEENEEQKEEEEGRSTEEYTLRPPVDTTISYKRRTAHAVQNIETGEEPNDNENIDDFMDFSFEKHEMSQLNLEMGVGTQTQKMMDYCITPVQLSPSVIYDTAHEREREASRINKKNLLKKMKANVKKYIKMVQDDQGMNNLVSEVKTKCFWDPEIMEACKQWDETIRNNPICVPPDSVQEHETSPSHVHQEPENPASEVHHEVTTNEEGRQDEEAQKVISNFLVQMASEGVLQPDDEGLANKDDGGVTDTLIANIQTVETGVYAYKPPAKESGENETVIEEIVNLAESTQNIQQKVQEKEPEVEAVSLGEKDPQQPDSGIEVEKEPEVACPQVTVEELQSVELLLSLGPSLEENKGKKPTREEKTQSQSKFQNKFYQRG
ncbi:uncharacterized protein LOC118486526 [Helianthus annuus]|uniref:uncharacterized protein LOC118486526 n=1 Tax=Helianthus annuus TaxID=4232 RepID=UPI0016530CCE|nr:uncharacterized protein LOC118486526 [Helianthus annuus]